MVQNVIQYKWQYGIIDNIFWTLLVIPLHKDRMLGSKYLFLIFSIVYCVPSFISSSAQRDPIMEQNNQYSIDSGSLNTKIKVQFNFSSNSASNELKSWKPHAILHPETGNGSILPHPKRGNRSKSLHSKRDNGSKSLR